MLLFEDFSFHLEILSIVTEQYRHMDAGIFTFLIIRNLDLSIIIVHSFANMVFKRKASQLHLQHARNDLILKKKLSKYIVVVYTSFEV